MRDLFSGETITGVGPIISTPTGKMLNRACQPKTRRITRPLPQFPGKGSKAQGQVPAPDFLGPALQEALAVLRPCRTRSAHSVLAVRRQGSDEKPEAQEVESHHRQEAGSGPPNRLVPETKPISTSLGCLSKLESTSTSRWVGATSGSNSHRGTAARRKRKEGQARRPGAGPGRVVGGRLETGGSWTAGHWWPRSDSFATHAKVGA